MDVLVKADIFFFISTVATVVLTILASVLLFYLIKAGKNFYKLSEALKGGFKESEEFVMDLKERLEENMVFRLFFPPARRGRRMAGKSENEKK
ncbi:MAG: hypothetical protein Q7S57_04465 [bacterium]|nr:hypothetical protein [bacterium]